MPSSPTSVAPHPTKKLKLARALLQSTIRAPAFHYLHLSLLSAATAGADPTEPAPAVDELTARTCLTAALQQFLGLTGAAIPVDILRCEGREVWARVPHEDAAAAIEALSGWVGADAAWRVRASGAWLGGLVAGDGAELFAD